MVRLPAPASNYVPSRIERWLQSVVMDKHGRMLLTASNLTGRFWDALQCFLVTLGGCVEDLNILGAEPLYCLKVGLSYFHL